MEMTRDLFKKIGDTKRIFHNKGRYNEGQKQYEPNRGRRD